MIDAASHSGRKFQRRAWDTVWEEGYPSISGLACGAIWFNFGYKLVAYSECQGWHLDQMYVGIFGLVAITTGFLGTFYGTIRSMSAGFIYQIRNTTVMKVFLSYIKSAMLVGFVTSLFSIPMMVASPLPTHYLSIPNAIVSVWVVVSVWSIAGFFRVVSRLFILFESDSSREIPGG